MCPVWTPLNPPPDPVEVQALSGDAWMILQALREAHRKKRDAWLRSQAPPDPKTYYRTLYQESFKQENPIQNQNIEGSDDKQVPTAMERVLDMGLSKSEEKIPPGSYELDAPSCRQHQNSERESIFTPSCSGSLRGPHPSVLAAPQESSKLDPGLELRKQEIGLNVEDFSGTCRLDNEALSSGFSKSTTTSNRPQTSFSPASPSDMLGGKQVDLITSRIQDSPPIDTQYFQEFDKTRHSVVSLASPSNSPMCSAEAGILRLKDDPGKTAGDLVGRSAAVGPVGGSHRYEEGIIKSRDGQASRTQVGVILGDSSKLACLPRELCRVRRQPVIGQSLAELAPQAPLAQKKQEGTRLSSRRKPASESIEGRQSVQGSQADCHSQDLPLMAHSEDGNVPSTSKEKTTSSVKAHPRKRKATQPTIEELFSDFNSDRDKRGQIKNVANMTAASREELAAKMASADEVSMTILYKDGSSQLREPDTMSCKTKRSGTDEGSAAECLVLAYADDCSKVDDGGLDFVSIPLASKQEEDILDWSREILPVLMGRQTARKICFDAQEMIHTVVCSLNLNRASVCTNWLVMDPKVAAWLLDADHPPITFSDLLSKHVPDRIAQSEAKAGWLSTCHDLWRLGAAMKHLFHSLNEAGLWRLFHDVEMRLCPILAVMEVQGICVQSQTLIDYGKLLESKIQQVERDAYEAAGHPFQITSHSQLRHVLFEELQLDKKYQGKKLARTNVLNLKSTSETVLVKLQALHPLPKLVLRYRQFFKLKSTYIDGILDCIDDGYIHTSWEQTSAASGRLQSANPNIQSIPKQPVILGDAPQDDRGEGEGEHHVTILARKPFVSRDGWSFIAADFQSIELRLLAHLSEDPVLLRAFNKRDCPDVFVELASQWLDMPASDVTTAEREKTKRIVYSVIYGVGPDKLAETLGVTREEAKSFTRSFLSTFRGVSTFTKACIACCQRHGLVRTLFKRRRLIPSINSADFHARSHAERQCVNFVVQGSAADICKIAMIQVVRALASRPQLKARLLVQIHDELLLEVSDEDVNEVKGIVKSVMEVTGFQCGSDVQLQVPLPVSISVGRNWGQLE